MVEVALESATSCWCILKYGEVISFLFALVISNLPRYGLGAVLVRLSRSFSMSKYVRLVLFAVVLVSILAVGAFAQSTTTGAIGGVVMDQGNAVVPGATVVVKNTGTNKED